MVDLPASLVDAVRSQRAVLFLGAGASVDAKHPTGAVVPVGDKLRDLISDKFLGGALKNRGLVAVAAMAANEVGLPQLQKYVHDVFTAFEPNAYHDLLPSFRWKAIVTTNYDLIIERAYDAAKGRGLQNLVKSVKDGDQYDARLTATTDPVGLFKIHGCIDHYADDSIPLILGQEQYASYLTNRERFYGRIRDLAYEYPIVFCGFSIADPHIQQIIFDLTDKGIKRPMYFQVSPGTDDIEVRYWATHQIACIKATFAEFMTALEAAIPTVARALPVALGGGTLSIRHHYRVASAVESNDLISYLATDATHMHSAFVAERQDPGEFYKGYDRGWGSIVQNLDVRRSTCDSVLVDAILLQEETRKGAELFMLRGPAGNGKTVVLKRTAWDAAVTYDQLVLYVSEPAGLQIRHIQEIYALTGKRIFVFVDRVALLRDPLEKLLSAAREQSLPVTVIGAERDNEWNIYCENLERYVRQDFSVGYLSEKAINGLLDLLGRHNALGLLAEKTPKDRVQAFAERAEKQLLVALHETTLGVPFEKIVLDEYARIEPPAARRLYLNICALHQFGALVRAGLISRASGITFLEFGDKLIDPLENVVLVDEARHGGDVYYRSRHQHVAELVFSQALPSDEEKYDVLAELMSAINIDYSSDNETWGRMIRGRAVARMFTSVDLGRLFYDKAEQIARNVAFVFHQRAVFEMQHPGGSLAAAETAARRAFELNSHSRSIQHTQAEIARRQAVETGDPLRRQAFRRAARDKLNRGVGRPTEYDVATRARLAIDELREMLLAGKDADKLQQSVLLDAVKEAQTTLQNGIQAFPDSADILAVEATFRELLDQAERARGALEKAFQINPRQDWLAIRLARNLLAIHDADGACKILEKCLAENPASKMAHLELARIGRKAGKSPALILDHLRRSFSEGDNNYEGQFHFARELFLQGQAEHAKQAFTHLNERAPGRFRTEAHNAMVDDNDIPKRIVGRIERKETGYAFVRFADFKDAVFASRGESEAEDWDKLRTGDSVTAFLAFNRRGPRATKLARSK